MQGQDGWRIISPTGKRKSAKRKRRNTGTNAVNQLTAMTGMILSAAPIGEYDKRVVILTKEKGKISAFAKGARRPNSPLAGACTPCNFGKFMLYEGRNSNTLQSARSRIILQSSARMWKRHTMHFIFSNLQIFIQGKLRTRGKC